jgi:flavin reductase (DIM6/NTAB) family NADH-FMN oxidoreductase RutF
LAKALSDGRRFRDACGRFPTGVIIITALTEAGQRIGMTVNSFSSVSVDPPLIQFSVRRQALSFKNWQDVTHYAVNILSEDQAELSN